MEQRDRVNENGAGIFKIPQANYEKFEAALAKLSKKAIKLGGEAFLPVPFSYEMVEIRKGEAIKVLHVLMDCTIPRIDGWEFIARIDHANGEVGNLVRALPGQIVPDYYRNTGCLCEHCNVKRFRRDTFLLRQVDTGEIKQVGSSCLKDFLGGHDPVKLAKLAELLSYANECASGYTNYVGADRRYIDLNVFLQFVSLDMRQRGFYVSRAVAKERGLETTSSRAMDMLYGSSSIYNDIDKQLTDDDRESAEAAIEWAQNLGNDGRELSDYDHNIKVLAASGFIEFRSTGYAASILQAYKRTLATVNAPRKVSDFVGEVGQKLTFEATLRHFSSKEDDRGVQFRYSFEDDNGNLFTWFTGIDLNREKGVRVKLAGKVKAFNNFNNVKSTILSHCKVENV